MHGLMSIKNLIFLLQNVLFVSLVHDNTTVQLHVWVKFQPEVYLPSLLQIRRLLLHDHDGCILGTLKFSCIQEVACVQSELNLKIQTHNKSPENRSRADLEILCISDQICSIIKEQ
jgi:hypothetical protein